MSNRPETTEEVTLKIAEVTKTIESIDVNDKDAASQMATVLIEASVEQALPHASPATIEEVKESAISTLWDSFYGMTSVLVESAQEQGKKALSAMANVGASASKATMEQASSAAATLSDAIQVAGKLSYKATEAALEVSAVGARKAAPLVVGAAVGTASTAVSNAATTMMWSAIGGMLGGPAGAVAGAAYANTYGFAMNVGTGVEHGLAAAGAVNRALGPHGALGIGRIFGGRRSTRRSKRQSNRRFSRRR